MDKAKIYLFTSPTCPHCPAAKKALHEFKNTRDDISFSEYPTYTKTGRKMARKYSIMSVPTIIIDGPGYQPIGLRGVQSQEALNKYVDIALGNRSAEEKKRGFRMGKFRFKF